MNSSSSSTKTSLKLMANISLSTTLIMIIIIIITTLLITAAHGAVVENTSSVARTLPEVLVQYGLPSGLFPETVESYTLSHNGELEVEIESSCCIVYLGIIYRSKISGKLSYGQISDVSGMEIMGDTYVWMNVIGIKLDSNTLEFQVKVAFLSKRYPTRLFADFFPTCTDVNTHRCFIIPDRLLDQSHHHHHHHHLISLAAN
ncbi:hypothetical protein Scep_003178 [Stephania cephalantha]|uniref:Uncharacterized protein n=1 Tax=Stephania cephalantha TaxID=152367 RepID=A0AAP0KRP7_9MAGN